jgi:hypothetical protein
MDIEQEARQAWIAASKTLLQLEFVKSPMQGRLNSSLEPEWMEERMEGEEAPIARDEIIRGMEAAIVLNGMLLDLVKIVKEARDVQTLYQVYYQLWRGIERYLTSIRDFDDDNNRVDNYPPEFLECLKSYEDDLDYVTEQTHVSDHFRNKIRTVSAAVAARKAKRR